MFARRLLFFNWSRSGLTNLHWVGVGLSWNAALHSRDQMRRRSVELPIHQKKPVAEVPPTDLSPIREEDSELSCKEKSLLKEVIAGQKVIIRMLELLAWHKFFFGASQAALLHQIIANQQKIMEMLQPWCKHRDLCVLTLSLAKCFGSTLQLQWSGMTCRQARWNQFRFQWIS